MPVESVRIMCPSLKCRKILAVPTSSRGKNVRCRSCSAIIRVPDKPVARPEVEAAGTKDPGSAKPTSNDAAKAA